ncbi:hypothetical protein H4219_003871 [Mycoemilia scoparia]|uniref:Uncharacterized protein n=1 Tax=Mycoemilia scoparia TaxID=417184 RepID=A0A9W8A1K1_9FUNG|nr:hypothetical protein H4219_003871 [Mycoemilia scoparia]
MSNRQTELELKKAKLAELRRARENRRRGLQESLNPRLTGAGTATAAGTPGAAAGSGRTSAATATSRHDVDSLVSSLVGRPTTFTRAQGARSMSAASTDGSSLDTMVGTGIDDRGLAASPTEQQQQQQQQQQSTTTTATTSRVLPELQTSDLVVIDVPPKEKVYYSKEVQTLPLEGDEDEEGASSLLTEEEVEKRIQAIREEDERIRKQQQEEEARLEAEIKAKEAEIKLLSEEEQKSIVNSGHFGEFFEKSAKIVERALDEDYDFMVDYSLSLSKDGDDASQEGGLGAREKIKLNRTFYSEKFNKGRSVTDICWSPKFSELVATSYNSNPRAPHEPDGLVCIWNEHLKDRPEFVFESQQSDVLKIVFSEFNPNILVGGTYSGQILLWDTRGKSQPQLKTPLTSAATTSSSSGGSSGSGGHTHPIYSLKIVGTRNAHQLISASTDGLVCTWQLDMLTQPQEVLELTHPNHGRTDEVAITSLDFPDSETVGFWIGTDEGKAYQANRYDRAGSKTGLNPFDAYTGHAAPISGLQFHPVCGTSDFTDLFLTSSFDWTTKLWRARPAAKPTSTTGTVNEILPLYSFDSFDDYVYDVKWSPTHPAVFGTVDGSGKFGFWNLNSDTEVPTHSVVAPNGGSRGLNKLAWNNNGQKVAVGSVGGQTFVYDVGELAVPSRDDFTRFSKTLARLAASSDSKNVGGSSLQFAD